MPRMPNATSMDDLVRDAIAPVASRAAVLIAGYIASLAADQLQARLLKAAARQPTKAAGSPARRRRPAGELARWVADRRARRVPTFVIQMTGLDTKKKIVAKFGEDAAFVKGKPAPEARAPVAKPEGEGKAVVKAKPPVVRKAASAK